MNGIWSTSKVMMVRILDLRRFMSNRPVRDGTWLTHFTVQVDVKAIRLETLVKKRISNLGEETAKSLQQPESRPRSVNRQLSITFISPDIRGTALVRLIHI